MSALILKNWTPAARRPQWPKYLKFCVCLGLCVSSALAGKQTLVLRLKQPLKAEETKVRISGAQNERGERRDLETVLPLGPAKNQSETHAGNVAAEDLSLDLTARRLGKSSILVGFTLPTPSNVEIVLLDSYGKTLATLTNEPYTKGSHLLPPFPYHESEQNGMRFIALKLNGKIPLRVMLPQVK